MEIVFFFIGSIQAGGWGMGPGGSEQEVTEGAARRSIDSAMNFEDMIRTRLQGHGNTYDHLESVDISALMAEKRNLGPRLSHRYILHGYHNSQNLDSDHTDVTIDHYDDDAFNLHLTPSKNSTRASLQKRLDGEGIKVAFTTRDSASLDNLDQFEINQFINQVVADWHDKVTNEGASQYFGLVKEGHAGLAYFRIIGETKSFGVEYEDVNACGQMAEFL